MESLDLNGLAKSLPAANFEKAEKELLNNFKAAALSITTLYRSSRHASKRAYNAGYAAACQDLMLLIQQGVSTGDRIAQASSSPDMSIGRILDWIEARMEAVKSREEEEDEDEEREKDRERERSRGTPSSAPAAPPPPSDNTTQATYPSNIPHKHVHSAPAPHRPDDRTPGPAPLTPHSPAFTFTAQPTQTSPSPTISSTSRPPPPNHRLLTKSRPRKDLAPDPASQIPPTPLSPSENISRMPQGNPISASTHPDTGAKRRHAVMMMLDSTPSSVTPAEVMSSSAPTNTPAVVFSGPGSARRRTRSQRSAGHVQAQLHAAADAMMEVEEDGRERKRVARR